jgi:C-terminal processing protease CtpA/Prc
MPALPFAAFSEKLMALADANPVRRFVVDLRHNGGGNSALAEPLIAELKQRPAINRKGVLFAVIGRRTFSSAVLNALQLRSETQATLVGEPTGGRPNHYGEVRSFSLPNSGLPVTYSTKYFAYAKEDTPSLTPDILVEVSSSDYFAGRDPVLEAILKS